MNNGFRLRIKFWGVRGSTPTPGSEYLSYGGNTSCIEILSANGSRIIIDSGTGIRNLGRQLYAENKHQTVHLFLTHFHWDHIQGLPFFAPLLQSGNKVHFHSFPDPVEIQARLKRQMTCPFFTLDFDSVGAERKYESVSDGFHLGDLSVAAFPLNHPQGACGYRVESQGASVVIATDVEHGDQQLDKVLRQHAESADLLVYDSQYTPAEYESRVGWGHSTYTCAASVAKDARVSQLALFHHDPTRIDAEITHIVKQAVPLFENTIAARELGIIEI